MNTKFLKNRLIAVFLSMALASVATAQTTSSNARDTVADANGAPIANATVTITHQPSGSVKVATTGTSGNFFQPGLRVGGPYVISANADGFRGSSVDQIYFSEGTQPALNLTLEAADGDIEEIVVSARHCRFEI